ncbi:Predicted Zn-dependent peptidase [Salinimicrobium catena]|uniref:Predicted Zn-dependent peptidase n=1 Tax=Salinimicrobium catena TaxID=390640 RepID=A0A1H5NS03_9FLAO|nr:pitrilysin family protein [Salinimicrobium catena]SDL55591.1 Predicted Zn-dependent peptidase [Salinimicrobium catena]SEF03498.1 Predicted Zn-dependent peptidase [Salinimicrobium catena]
MKKIMKLFLLLMITSSGFAQNQQQSSGPNEYNVPVEYYTLDNGLKVILSPDETAPTAIVAVYYNIGFRIEPKDRTGFAHLFEHMMFQGSQNLGKMEFIKLVQENGGVLNGSTRFDFTNYFEIVPANKLETMLWAEADRMRGLDITQENLTNQQGVVKNEVKVNVLNQPYGGFPWLDMPQYANTNWYNAHNFYGDLEDLDAATLEDVESFFNTYYSPNNAALAVVGDFDMEKAKQWIKEYFGDIPAADLPKKPDISEPRQEKEKQFVKNDSLANKPAMAIAYHMPERNTPEYYAMGLLNQILVQGDNALLQKKLVDELGYTSNVSGGINYLGNMFNYNGPMQFMFNFTYDNETSKEQVVTAVDEVMNNLKITPEMLDNAIVKMRSQLYDDLGGTFGLGRADLLATFALFDDDPARINELEGEFKKVTPELMNKTVSEYLRRSNRTILTVNPLLANNENPN